MYIFQEIHFRKRFTHLLLFIHYYILHIISYSDTMYINTNYEK